MQSANNKNKTKSFQNVKQPETRRSAYFDNSPEKSQGERYNTR